ncbi:MAG: phage holin family protein [Acidobacteria bacterium]|nr:phage holin family protein [Acidobacteriota bacterium]MBI3280912.1 phage holin family protein [Acidobacteriota bacterium]
MNDSGRQAGGVLSQHSYPRAGDAVRERPMTDIVKDVLGNVQEIVRSEVRLARAEVREEVQKTISGTKLLAIGVFIGLYAVGFVLLGIVAALATAVSTWAAALVVGFGLLIVAGICAMAGRSRLRRVTPKPERTIETMKENLQWMKDQTK